MRQVISDFLDRLHNTAGTISLREESDKMVQIYSDERYSLNDLAAILEDDVTILLRELKSESAAIEHDAGNQCWENVHKSNTFLISGVIRLLIDRAAGVRVFLSDDFLSQHEDDIFLNTRFANYVRNEYKAKGKPQQKHIEAPQKPIGGISGELAGNGKKTHKEHTKKTFKDRIAGNVDSDALIAKLHTLMDSKKGKDAFIYLAVCIKDGKLISLPTYKETTKIFPNIGCKAGYYRYTETTKYRDSEIEGARKALNNDK